GSDIIEPRLFAPHGVDSTLTSTFSARFAMMRLTVGCLLGGGAFLLLALPAAPADDQAKKDHDADKDHVVVPPDDVKWGKAPPALPAGAQAAVLVGDPSKAGAYVVRVKLPDGYKVPPHWHPTDENVTVIKGTLMIGKGETFKEEGSEALPAGSYM